ncbi:tetratricopeptide repeat protein, partial [Micromonospora sp. STR1_7]|nr:tetratricopeptide repeat protein [Micromonospora parastrephiae]
MPEGRDDPALSATEELALARLALDEGDLHHAAGHLAGALARAPTLPEVHETLARLAAASGGGLDLFPINHHTFVGAVVARAHLLAATGHPAEGLELLAAATGYAPGTEWAGVPWVTEPELAERLDPEHIARILMQVCSALPDPVPRIGRAALTPYLTLARNAITVRPEHGLLLGAASALARRLGEVALAIRWAARGVRAQPSKMGEVWLGYAYRSAGRTRDALAALNRAVALEPDDLAVYADIAGTLADTGRLDEALEWTERALARDPSFDCAVHTAHRLRHLRDGDLAHLVALADFVRDHPDDSHEHGDLAQCCRGRPWLGQLTPADGPLIDAMRRAVADDDNGVGSAVRLTAAAPPSAVRTVTSTTPGLRIEITGMPEPDPREPRRASAQPAVGLRGQRPDARAAAALGGGGRADRAGRPPGVAAPPGGLRRGGWPGRPRRGRPARPAGAPAGGAGQRGGSAARRPRPVGLGTRSAGVGLPGTAAPPHRRAVGRLDATPGAAGPGLGRGGLGDGGGAVRPGHRRLGGPGGTTGRGSRGGRAAGRCRRGGPGPAGSDRRLAGPPGAGRPDPGPRHRGPGHRTTGRPPVPPHPPP